jgi:methionine aminopeptidase
LGFSLNSFENEVTAKLGVSESLKHDLLNAYPVLTEKKGELVAQFKITVMILQGSTITITGLPIDLTKFKTENAIKD